MRRLLFIINNNSVFFIYPISYKSKYIISQCNSVDAIQSQISDNGYPLENSYPFTMTSYVSGIKHISNILISSECLREIVLKKPYSKAFETYKVSFRDFQWLGLKKKIILSYRPNEQIKKLLSLNETSIIRSIDEYVLSISSYFWLKKRSISCTLCVLMHSFYGFNR